MTLLVQASKVSKDYQLYDEADRSLKGRLVHLFKTGHFMRYESKRVLQDVTFSLHTGDVLGIIGENGAGKSTLLKIIAGILSPSEGRIITNGRLVALLEIGLGFHPDLTGRENSFLYGSLLGITNKEMRSMLDDIVGFAELQDFIDLPLRKYSSGMKMRLAFSIATAVDPDILILDEVFSVGDVFFQKKSEQRLLSTIKRGRGLLFVSHDTQAVLKMCNRALLLRRDGSITLGEPNDIVAEYLGQRQQHDTVDVSSVGH